MLRELVAFIHLFARVTSYTGDSPMSAATIRAQHFLLFKMPYVWRILFLGYPRLVLGTTNWAECVPKILHLYQIGIISLCQIQAMKVLLNDDAASYNPCGKRDCDVWDVTIHFAISWLKLLDNYLVTSR